MRLERKCYHIRKKKKLVKIQPQKATNYTVWVALKHCFIPLNIKGNVTSQNTRKRKACYTKKERTKFVIVSHRVSCLSTSPLAILQPPELQTHSIILSDSPSPSKNSVVLSIFLKSKNPNHWVLFPSAQSTWLKGKKKKKKNQKLPLPMYP